MGTPSKSLRIIGIQIFDKTDACVRKALEPGWYPFIKCVNDDEIGTNPDVYPIPDDDACPPDYFALDKEDEDMPLVNLSAIVGKNGTGKSSLMDILYGILNNFAESLLTPKDAVGCDELSHAFGLNARLHFILDGVFKYIHVDDGPDLYFKLVNGKPEPIYIKGLDLDGRKAILKDFFYTISVNYSLYAFNPDDRKCLKHLRAEELYQADWLYNLFHKNDGYYVPIVLTPFRAYSGNINVSKENRLAAHRLSILSLLFQSQKKAFLPGYKAETLTYKHNSGYSYLKLENYRHEHCPSELRDHIDTLIPYFISAWEKLLKKVDGDVHFSTGDERKSTELFYLGYKSARICLTYPTYKEAFGYEELLSIAVDKYIDDPLAPGKKKVAKDADGTVLKTVPLDDLRDWLNKKNQVIDSIVEELYATKDNHITAKIQQCLSYLRRDTYRKDNDTISVENIIGEKEYTKYDDVMQLLPPAFIDYELHFKLENDESGKVPEITFSRMSSGERQLLNALSYVFYHIHNISSINENGDRVISYGHINLIFDEAELYYHPEYQRNFVMSLLEKLKLCHIKRNVIQSINIMIITHSPFILSDVPSSDILYLPLTKNKDKIKTFGGNIYDMLKDSFFLESAMGDFAQRKLNDILMCYNHPKDKQRKEHFLKKQKEFRYTVSQLGEPYLHNAFSFMIDEMEGEYLPNEQAKSIDNEIKYLEEEVERLQRKKIQLAMNKAKKFQHNAEE